METSIKKDWLNPKEVKNEYGLSISTLAKWRMSKKFLKFSKIGKYIKYQREDIEALLNNNIVNAEIV
jgi:predicted site-specific integrase-resolvase